MKRYLKTTFKILAMLGLDPRRTIKTLRALPFYIHDYRTLKRQQRQSAHIFPFATPYPCLEDRFAKSGTAKGHYFHQDLLVARRIFSGNPQRHVDIGSRVDGFVAHVASFREIEVLDIRELTSNLPNIKFTCADLMGELPPELHDYCDSLSCLHALEHFGLGRYGDPLDYDGYLRGLENLHNILKQDGKLYFSVPIGPQRIEFNAHRVFSLAYLLELFGDRFRIDAFSYVDDKDDLHENEPLTEKGINDNFACRFGCGIFELTKQ